MDWFQFQVGDGVRYDGVTWTVIGVGGGFNVVGDTDQMACVIRRKDTRHGRDVVDTRTIKWRLLERDAEARGES